LDGQVNHTRAGFCPPTYIARTGEFYHSMSDTHPTELLALSLEGCIEALLFVAPGAVTPAQLAAALEVPLADVEQGLADLQARYESRPAEFGLRLQRHQGRFQLTSAPQAAAIVERFLGLESTSRLTRAALEALAIIAYQQPVTRPHVDAIRGVNSDGVLKNLLSKGLVQEVGRAEAPGRPILYGTTPEFLQYFGLNALDEMPALQLESTKTDSQNNDPDLLKN
jgi:segregation and condensation protein B